MAPVSRPEPQELPRLSVAIRRMSHLSGPKEQFSGSACCSLEQKRAYMAGGHSSDPKLISTSSLWGRLCQLLPPDSTLETRMTMEKLFQQYSDSCGDLAGRDTTDLGDLSAFMTLLCFGHLGPKFFELLDRGVSKEDFPRHSSIQNQRPTILRQMGGTGAKNIQESWNKMCICLASLITHRLFISTRDCMLDLMRKCRVAVESDSSFILTVDNSGVQKTVVKPATVGFKLDWDGAKAIHQSMKEKSSRLLRMLFARTRSGSSVEIDRPTCNNLPSVPGDSAATEALKLALSLPLAAPRAHDKPVASSVKAVDLAVLFEELSPKAASLGIPLNELMDMVFISLGSSRSSDIVQNELCELIGWDCIDLVFALLRERSAWVTTYQSRNDPENFVEQKHTRMAPSISGEEPKGLVQQLIHDPISVAAARAAQLEANARATAARLQQVMASGPSASTKAAEFKRSLPFVYDQLAELRERVAFVDSSRPRLPAGTTYKQLPLWDEVQFPTPTKPPSSVLDVPRVQIASLDSIGQQAFAGMQELNLIQSVVYPVAYHTAENLLVSAPTGAGKTNVAMLAIVQLLRSHLTKDSVLDLKSFKIVYLAPMKALAAELAATFANRLAPLGLKVRECTGDMQLSKQEILETQMLVSTPEKWDVISRKRSGDATLVTLVKLLIIDEIHLLHEDRGAVIEVLVARTLRQVETSQTLIRLVGLSATLPNYEDVAHFLHVNPYRGLFYFDDRFRPVPLRMSFYGVRGSNRRVQEANMNAACYELLLEQVKRDEQVMVFVHARGDTVKTARWLCDTARQQQQIAHFQVPERNDRSILMKRIDRCGDMALRELLPFGFACHHAGMLRQDRTLVERLFAAGHIRTLVCTATLAWGVNLPAHAVIIKGTRVYKAEKSDFVELDILDVLQIFGRAGRPQFDTQGVASIITSIDKMDHYLRLITNQHPIESSLLSNLNDHLNAEIALGTVTNIDDAVTWLKDTYLFVRLMKNPLHYGIQADLSNADSTLSDYLGRVVRSSALDLDAAEMIRYEPQTGQLASTDRGRTASLFYIRFSTAAMVRDTLEPTTMLPQLFSVLSEASEFVAMKVRDEEGGELNDLKGSFCRVPIQKAGNVDSDVPAKVNALLQGYISRHAPVCHSLASDMNYIHQNAGRLVRYLFELSLRQGWSSCASTTLQLARMIEQRQWDGQTPLWQFAGAASHRLLQRVDEMELSVDRIRETGIDELTHLLHFRGRDGAREVSQLAALVPRIQLSAETQPITRTILRVRMTLEPDFTWSDRSHGTQQNFWIWIEDPDQGLIYHSEYWTLTKRTFKSKEPSFVVCTIPLFEPFPTQYLVRVSSDQWLGADTVCPLSFKRLLLPPPDPPHTDLLNLEPLPVCALQNSQYELLYKFTHFNPIQTQIFHTLYHQDVNVLLGAPTGSGKTVAAELAIFRVFNETPSKKCVYIAPLKALVRERIDDWSVRIGKNLAKRVVELTGDVTPDIGQLMRADLIVTTPEKWDGISRSWQQRVYVRHIGLIIIDEIHLLGEERGPVLEVIVSRANYIASQLGQSVRIIGLSTALSNAPDLASWLRIPITMTGMADVAAASGTGIGQTGRGLFNFRPSVRPVPLETHIQGYPGRHYCPRMATMNRPIYLAIASHSPNKPVLIFVSSRRQTRLTALDLVSFIASSGDSKKWLHMDPEQMDVVASSVHDPNLRLTLSFGIGLHHAGLQPRDRSMVEELFVNQKIQILIATSTLAWGVNFPAHLVVVKGTEFYDGKTMRYVDYPITDVLQMMGRAGRPQFDDQGKAVIMVQDTKKAFYKRFLYEPFPVESCLLQVLPDHLNAEVVAGTISTRQQALDYLTWTFFFRRLLANPSYYGLEDCQPASVSAFLSGVISDACNQLVQSSCLELIDPRPDGVIASTALGRIASYYYLSHKTMRLFADSLKPSSDVHALLQLLANAHEYDLLPVRHNEDEMNRQLATMLPLKRIGLFDCPHTKTHLLLQAHFTRLVELPVADYVTDTRSVLDQAPRIVQAMLDVCAQCGWLATSLNCLILMQMLTQGVWVEDVGSSLLQLPGIQSAHLDAFRHPDMTPITCLPELIEYVTPNMERLDEMLKTRFRPNALSELRRVIQGFPIIDIRLSLVGPDPTHRNSQSTSVLRPCPLDTTGQSPQPLVVYAETDYTLRVHLTRHNPMSRRHQPVTSSALVKSKTQECWVLIFGDVESNRAPGGELLALKRVSANALSIKSTLKKPPSAGNGRAVHLTFRLPAPPPAPKVGVQPRRQHRLTLYLMSDTHLGLDQQVSLLVDVVPAVTNQVSFEDNLEL